MTKNPLVSIVVLNYNGKHLLERFLPSVKNMNYSPKEILIVENASTDGSLDFLRNTYPEFLLVVNAQNYGTAEGSNIGARQAKGEYIFFISNDMELEKDILGYMVEEMESDRSIGICTCKMKRITEQGEKLVTLDSVGADLDVFGFPCSRGIGQKDIGQLDKRTQVFFSFGGALLIRKEIFEKVHGYDPDFFTLSDDIDLCWRVQLLGYKVVVQPKAYLYHRVSATLGTIYARSHKRYLSEKNTLSTILKNYSLCSLLVIMPWYLLLLAGEILFFALIGKTPLASSGIKAGQYTLNNFPKIRKKRAYVQGQRKVSDMHIFQSMRKKSYKLDIFLDFLKSRGRGPNWDNYFG